MSVDEAKALSDDAKKRLQEKSLREDPVGKLLFRLSLPAVVGMSFNCLYNIVDTIFVGQAVGALALGGLTVAFPILMLVIAVTGIVGIGTQTNISILFGAGKMDEAETYARTSYALLFLISIVLLIALRIFLSPILRLFGATPELLTYAADYMYVILWSIIPWMLTMQSNGILRSEGNARVPMLIMVLGNIINIALDPVFIYVFDMGIQGAALATVVSEYITCILAVGYIATGRNIIQVDFRRIRFLREESRNILRLGFPAFLGQAMGSISSIVINNTIVLYGGALALSTAGILNRTLMFIFLPMVGVMQALNPILGFNYGAKNLGRVLKTVRTANIFLVLYGVVIITSLVLLRKPIVHLFVSESDAIAIGVRAISLAVWGLPLFGLFFVSVSMYQATGHAIPAMLMHALRQIGILFPTILLFPKLIGIGLDGVWLAISLADALSIAVAVGFMLYKIRSLKVELGDALAPENL